MGVCKGLKGLGFEVLKVSGLKGLGFQVSRGFWVFVRVSRVSRVSRVWGFKGLGLWGWRCLGLKGLGRLKGFRVSRVSRV